VSGGEGSDGQCVVVDVTGTLCLPPAYDTLIPLYDNKDLPNYQDVVHGVMSQEPPPPSYDTSQTTSRSTAITRHSDDTSPISSSTIQPQQSN